MNCIACAASIAMTLQWDGVRIMWNSTTAVIQSLNHDRSIVQTPPTDVYIHTVLIDADDSLLIHSYTCLKCYAMP